MASCPGKPGRPCGRTIEPVLNGRPRKLCSVCSPSRPRRKALAPADSPADTPDVYTPVTTLPVRQGVYTPPPVDELEAPVGPLEAAHREALTRLGIAEHPDGLLVLNLARRLDRSTESGSAHASMANQLMRAAERAYAGAPITPDALDELARRRESRATGGAS